MSFLECINKKIAANVLDKKQAEKLKKKLERLTAQYKNSMGDEAAAIHAAETLVKLEAEIIAQKKVNAIRAALKQKQIIESLEVKVEKGIAFHSAVGQLYEKVLARKGTILKQLFSNIDEFIDQYRSKFAGLYRDSEGVVPVIRELLGQHTENREAAMMGRSLRETLDMAQQRYKLAGGVIGYVENYFPTYHTKELIRKVNFEDWYGFMRSRLNTDHMIDFETGLPFEDDVLKIQMKKDYEGIVTNGRSKLMERAEEGKQTFGFGSDVSERHSQSRFYFFKDADAFLEYNEKFGSGRDGLYDMLVNHFEGMARDIAMLEVLGPKPNAIARHLDLQMTARDTGFVKKGWVNGMYDVISGKVDGSVSDSAWFSVVANTQNLLRSALLGMAPIAALSDSTFIKATANFNGLSGTKAMMRYAKMMNPLNGADRRLAKKQGYIADIARGRALSDTRFAGESMGGRATSWLAQFTVRANGLTTMTKAAADAISLEMEGTLADLVERKTTWGALPNEFRASAIEHGITEGDWKIISKSGFTEPDKGLTFLRSNNIVEIKGENPEALKRIADSLDDWITTMRAVATNEPTLAMRSLSTGAFTGEGRRGTVTRALFSSVFMMKSFPISVIMNHVAPAVYAARNGKFNHLMTVAIGTTLLGGLALQASEIAKGRDPRNADNAKFWVAALAKGGGLGLFGDFLFADYTQFGRNPLIDATVGPVGGLIKDSSTFVMGDFNKLLLDGESTTWAKDAFNLAKKNTPAVNLWYSKLLVERLLLDNLERMADDNFDKRISRLESAFMNDYQQEYWWKRGENEPRRAPNF